MLKFFRKYNAVILAVAASFLMVAFLLPQAIHQIAGDPRDRAVARLASGRITLRQAQQAAKELQVLESIGATASSMFGAAAPSLTHDVLGISSAGDVTERMHWLMLVDEARKGGYIAGPGSANIFIEQAADFYARRQIEFYTRFSNDPTALESLIPRWRQGALQALQLGRQRAISDDPGGMQSRFVDGVLAKAAAVTQMYAAVLTGSAFSDLEAMQRVRRGLALDAVNIRFLIFHGDAKAREAPEPTEEQLQAHFEAHKSVYPADGEYGFGYLRAPAVNFEWIEIDPDRIASAVEIGTLDAHAHWRKNRAKYKGEFEAERERVVADLKHEKADEIARFATQVVQAEILQARERLPDDGGGYKALPEDWAQQRPDFGDLANLVVQRVRERFNVQIETPWVRNRLAWRTVGEVNVEPGLGQSAIGDGPSRKTAAQLLFGVREFGESAAQGTQVGLTFGPTETFDGKRYFIRALEIRKESPPDSLDEVRARAVADWKSTWAFEQLIARQSALRERAALVGLELLAEEESLGAPPSAEWEVRRTAMTAVQAGDTPLSPPAEVNTQSFRDAVLAAGLDVPPTTPFEQIDPQKLTLSHRVDSSRALVIAQIVSINPMSWERYRSASSMLPILTTDALQSALAAFAPSALASRLGFEHLGEREEDEQPAAPTVEHASVVDDHADNSR